MIPLTCNEIARPAAVLITQPGRDARHLLARPAWRRHHQHTARTCYYQHQATHGP
jgi:hypothetical protein